MSALRFTPSAAARAINTGRSKTVAALLPTLENSTFARFTEELEDRLGEHGLSLVVATTGEDPALELAKAQQMVNIGAEALIVTGASQDQAFRTLVDRHSVPCVSVSLFDDAAWVPTIGYDNTKAALLALEHLIGLGHHHIAVVHGPADGNDRTRARLDALATASPQFRTPGAQPVSFRFFETQTALQGGFEAADKVLSTAPDTTAILAFTDVLASGVLNLLHRRGMRVPQQMSVIGMEDLPDSAFMFPPLTTVHLPVRRMGAHTADILSLWLEKGQKPDHQELPVMLNSRESTARKRSNS